jgi:hypothetical protein
MKFLILIAILLISSVVQAEECYGKCLTEDQVNKVKKALDELDKIHESPAVVEFQEPIIIIRDWDNRVYINGGEKKLIPLKIRIGDTIDRDMMVKLESQVWYREKPEPPMFRLRIRAQAGILVPEMARTFSGNKDQFWDAGVGWDFFHLGVFNMTAFTGVKSAGIGPGIDLTKNFGVYAGYSFVYDGFKSSALTSVYFSFN